MTKLVFKFYLSVSDNADNFAVSLHCLQILLNHLLAQIILPFLRGLGECLLFGFVPLKDLTIVERTTWVNASSAKDREEAVNPIWLEAHGHMTRGA